MKVHHPYQARDTERLIFLVEEAFRLLALAEEAARAGQWHLALIYATGAGKTLVALSVATLLMHRSLVTHVVIAAPFKNLVGSFAKKAQDTFCLRAGDLVWTIPKVVTSTSGNVLGRYLKSENQEGEILGLKHQALAGKATLMWLNGCIEETPKFAYKKLLVLDEGHHPGERRSIAIFRNRWLQAGGLVMSLTATPDRGDGTEALSSEVLKAAVYRSMSAQMREGFAPEQLQSAVKQVAGKATKDKDGASGCPTDPVETELLTLLEADAFPKSVIRLQNQGDAKENADRVLDVIQAAQGKGLRVWPGTGHENARLSAVKATIVGAVRERLQAMVACGNAKPDMLRLNEKFEKGSKIELSDILEYENAITNYEESCLDIIVGMGAVTEGMDWCLCSHFFFVGVPGKMLTLIQGIGRTTRPKTGFIGYPARWRQTSKVVLVVAGRTEDLGPAHERQVLNTACYLAAFRQWDPMGVVLSHVDRALYRKPAKPTEGPEGTSPDVGSPPKLSEEDEQKLAEVFGETPEQFKKDLRIREALDEAEAFFRAGVITRGQIIRNPPMAVMTKTYIDAEMSQAVYGDISVWDIRRKLFLDSRDAKPCFERKFEEHLGQGETIPEAAWNALREGIEDDESSSISEASELVASFRQTITLNANNMDQMEQATRPAEAQVHENGLTFQSYQPGGVAAAYSRST